MSISTVTDRPVDKSVDFCVDTLMFFGTIFHHPWDHDFLVDVCPGPFLTTFGTIGQWSFFDISEKRSQAQKVALKGRTKTALVASCMHAWQSPYEIVGDVATLVVILGGGKRNVYSLNNFVPSNTLDYLSIVVSDVVCCFLSCV